MSYPDPALTSSLAPSLALCIPAYNAAAVLPRLLRSAQAQTQAFTEIWVYDDASTDDTAAIATAHGAQVVRGETNRGCSWGKNVLLAHSQSDWIHFHDADDELKPDFVERAQDWMGRDAAPDVVLFGFEYRDAQSHELLATYQFDRSALEADAIAYCIQHQINPFCGLYRRESLLACGGYDTDPAVLYNEDVAFHCRLAIAGLRFSADSAVTVINYRSAHSMSGANQQKCLRAQYQVMAKVAAAVPSQYQGAIATKLWQIAGVAAAYADWDTANACASLAQPLDPLPHLSDRAWLNQIGKLNPFLVLRLREFLIRRFKPQSRPTPTSPPPNPAPITAPPSSIPASHFSPRFPNRFPSNEASSNEVSFMQPLVSILIACYNAETWLAETLDSALAQTWKNIEIIVVDDGSTDNSWAIANRYAARGIQILCQPNRGASAARNLAYRHSSGDYIQYLDADDLLAPDKIEVQINNLQFFPETVAMGEWARFYQQPDEALFIPQPLWHDFNPIDFLITAWSGNWMMHPGAWLVPRGIAEEAGPWNESLSLNDDGEYFSRIVLASQAIQFCPGARSYYRSGLANSLSGTKSERAWQSALQSIQLSSQALLAAENSARTRQACATLFQRFLYEVYPDGPELLAQAEAQLAELGPCPLQPEGGLVFQGLRHILGWQRAKRWQRWAYRSGYPRLNWGWKAAKSLQRWSYLRSQP